jgi:tetratricopeptide (TPR) repeat protein
MMRTAEQKHGSAASLAQSLPEPGSAASDRAEVGVHTGSSGLDAIRRELEALREQVHQNDSEIDVLQIKAEKSWYKDASVLIALLAFLFSFGTTLVSIHRTNQQDVQAARAELRGLIQRLNALPKENLEANKATARVDAAALSGTVSAENLLIAKQAMELIERRIPENQVTAVEYLIVANAFSSNALYDEAFRLLDRVLAVERDHNEHVWAYRLYGWSLMLKGDLQRGREMYQRALAFKERYPSVEPGFAEWTNGNTYAGWAMAELSAYQCHEAQERLERAAVTAATWTGPAWEQLRGQIAELRKASGNCA